MVSATNLAIKWDFKVILSIFTQVDKLMVYFSESQEKSIYFYLNDGKYFDPH